MYGERKQYNLTRPAKLQKRVARIATSSPYNAHTEPLIEVLGGLTINQMIDSETVKIVYKALYNEAREYVNELFHRLSDTQGRDLRNSKNRSSYSAAWLKQ